MCKMDIRAIAILAVLIAIFDAVQSQGPVLKPSGGGGDRFKWRVKPLTGGGRLNGASLTGTWRPFGTQNSFSGTGSWQSGKGLGGSISGTIRGGGGGNAPEWSFRVGGGGGKGVSGSVGLKLRFRRRRRNALNNLLRI